MLLSCVRISVLLHDYDLLCCAMVQVKLLSLLLATSEAMQSDDSSKTRCVTDHHAQHDCLPCW